jgi:response regulator RpfG family c-di-GMP phosphodiesterase
MLVSREPREIELVVDAFGRDDGVRVTVVASAAEAAERAAQEPPDLVLLTPAAGTEPFAWAARWREDPRRAAACLALAGAPGDEDLRRAAVNAGFDELLTTPLSATELRARVVTLGRLRAAERAAAHAEAELARLREAQARAAEEWQGMLTELVGLAVPGALERAARRSELALQLAARLDIPGPLQPDLERAARLVELGRATDPDAGPGERALPPSAEHWQYAEATRALLERVEPLRGVAELIGCIYENWDGTGHPHHLQQGQIPLRSRILRVLLDQSELCDGAARRPPARALEELQERSGTRYDPMVVVHLRALAGAGGELAPSSGRVRIQIPALRHGMVLAEDLYTDSGFKLLSRATRLTDAMVDFLLERHRTEPILHGAVVIRREA